MTEEKAKKHVIASKTVTEQKTDSPDFITLQKVFSNCICMKRRFVRIFYQITVRMCLKTMIMSFIFLRGTLWEHLQIEQNIIKIKRKD